MTTPAQLANTVREVLLANGVLPNGMSLPALAALVELAEKAAEWQMAAGAEAQHADEVQAERDAAVADNQTLKVLGDKWVDRAAAAETRAAKLEAACELADVLADSYGRQWAKDDKFYAYTDARAALLVSAGRDEEPEGLMLNPLKDLNTLIDQAIANFNARAKNIELRSRSGEYGKWPWQHHYGLWPWQRKRK